MMRRLGVSLAASVLGVATAVSAAPAAPAITNPDWLERPSGETVAKLYPKLAARLGIEGSAILSCLVNAQSRLTDCTAVAETPQDLGFGAAALAMSQTFQMKPRTVNGQPVDGGTVRIPIRFTLPEDEPPREPPAAPSEAALRQAERLVDVTGAVARGEEETMRLARQEAQGLPPETWAAAEKALRQATEAHRGELRSAYARAFASVFTVEELAAIADFTAGPGQAVNQDPTLWAASILISHDFWQRLREPGRAAFCAKRACGTPAALEDVWRAAAPSDNRLDNPQWIWTPSQNTLLQETPALAAALGLTGAVRMTCRLDKAGALEDCRVDEQLPAGLGYGAAAQGLSRHYRLSPIQLDAGAAGRKVTVRIGFPPPPLSEPYKPVSGGSVRAVELARRLSAEDDATKTSLRDVELAIVNFEARSPKDVDRAVWDDAIDAFRTGAQAAAQQGLEYQINAVAAALTEDQLATFVAFRTSPAGRAQHDMRESLDLMVTNAAKFVGTKIIADAKATYCKVRDCTSLPPASQPTAASPDPSTRKP